MQATDITSFFTLEKSKTKKLSQINIQKETTTEMTDMLQTSNVGQFDRPEYIPSPTVWPLVAIKRHCSV